MRRSSLVVTFAVLAVVAACGDNHKVLPDAGTEPPGGAVEMLCETLQPLPATIHAACAVTAGGTTTLLKGNVLTSAVLYKGGQVAINPQGKIACVGCNCATGGETTVVCPDAAISP